MTEVDAGGARADKVAHPESGPAVPREAVTLPAATRSAGPADSNGCTVRYPASHFDPPPKRDAYDIVDDLPSTNGDWATPTPSVLHVQHHEDDGDLKSDEEKGLLDPEARAGMPVQGGAGQTKGGVLQTWRQNKRALLIRVFCVAATLFAIAGLIAATVLNEGNQTQATQPGLLTDPLIL